MYGGEGGQRERRAGGGFAAIQHQGLSASRAHGIISGETMG